MYKIFRRYVKAVHLMEMFAPSTNDQQMSKTKYDLWMKVSHKIYGDRSKEVWDFI